MIGPLMFFSIFHLCVKKIFKKGFDEVEKNTHYFMVHTGSGASWLAGVEEKPKKNSSIVLLRRIFENG